MEIAVVNRNNELLSIYHLTILYNSCIFSIIINIILLKIIISIIYIKQIFHLYLFNGYSIQILIKHYIYL